MMKTLNPAPAHRKQFPLGSPGCHAHRVVLKGGLGGGNTVDMLFLDVGDGPVLHCCVSGAGVCLVCRGQQGKFKTHWTDATFSVTHKISPEATQIKSARCQQ